MRTKNKNKPKMPHSPGELHERLHAHVAPCPGEHVEAVETARKQLHETVGRTVPAFSVLVPEEWQGDRYDELRRNTWARGVAAKWWIEFIEYMEARRGEERTMMELSGEASAPFAVKPTGRKKAAQRVRRNIMFAMAESLLRIRGNFFRSAWMDFLKLPIRTIATGRRQCFWRWHILNLPNGN